MKKLIMKSVLLMTGTTILSFGASLVIAIILNNYYWNVPSSFVYDLSTTAYHALVGYCSVVVFLAGYLAAALRIHEWIRLRDKEVEN